MVTAGHAGFAAAAFLLLWRSLAQEWVDGVSGDPITLAAIRLGLPIASVVASGIAIGLGWNARRERTALIADALSVGCVGVLLFGLALGPAGRAHPAHDNLAALDVPGATRPPPTEAVGHRGSAPPGR